MKTQSILTAGKIKGKVTCAVLETMGVSFVELHFMRSSEQYGDVGNKRFI